MKQRYASMSNFLIRAFGITDEMDRIAFRQHDHDYGTKQLVVSPPQEYSHLLMFSALDRREADLWLCYRLIDMGMPKYKAWTIWLGCRLLLEDKWQRKE